MCFHSQDALWATECQGHICITLSYGKLPVNSQKHKNMAIENNVSKKKHGGRSCHKAKGSDSWCLKSPRGIWSFVLLAWGPCQNGIHGLSFQCILEWQCAREGVRSCDSEQQLSVSGSVTWQTYTEGTCAIILWSPALKHKWMTETSCCNNCEICDLKN